VIPLATDQERILIAGHTGSGKTHEALHHLSQRSIDVRPWVILDFKGDDLVSSVPVTEPWTLADGPPDAPGLYVVTCQWDDGEPGGAADRFLRAALDRGNIGIFIDEGQRLGQQNPGLRAVLTQGRSKFVPLIFLTQRPRFVDTFALSESEYLQFFNLPHPDDRDRIARFVPADRLDFARLQALGPHHSFLYDVRNDRLHTLGPAPDFATIHRRILTRLPRYDDGPDHPAGRNPRRIRV
jgi:hypothetical protein